MKLLKAVIAALALAAAPLAAVAQNAPAAEAAAQRPPMTGLTKRTGEIVLPEAKARLNMGKDFYFLDAKDAKRVLTEAWGNPPNAVSDVLGMVIPSKFEPDAEDVWGAVVTFQDVGYVEDKDARSEDYDKLLKDMRSTEAEDNAQLKKQGYPTVHLVGWAEAPSYDAASHVLIWARDLAFEGAKVDTLNYDIRVLGRYGVLSLNAVGAMSDMSAIRSAAASVRQTASFDAGARYADVNKASDKMAGFGLAGLVAAGAGVAVAKKAGLLALILAFGKKALVLIVAGGAAIAAWVRRTFGLKPKGAPAASAEAPALEAAPAETAEVTPPPPPEASPPERDIVS